MLRRSIRIGTNELDGSLHHGRDRTGYVKSPKKVDQGGEMQLLTPDELKRAFPAVEEENMIFRAFLKGLDPDELDKLVHEMQRELFGKADCIACSNCCKVIVPVLSNDDVARIARLLGLSEQDFRTSYLENVDEEWVFNSKPCPFLTEKGCSIYDYRPEMCREYPFTDKD